MDWCIYILVVLCDELDGCIGCGCFLCSDCLLCNLGDCLGEEGIGVCLLEDEQN